MARCEPDYGVLGHMFGVFLLRSSNRQVHHGRDDRVWSAASMPGWRKIPSHEEYIHAIRERNQNIARNGLMSERALGAGASAAATGSLAPHNTKGNASIKKSKGKRAIRKKKSRPQILLEKAPQQKRTTRSNAQLPLQSQKDAKNAPEQADQAYVSVQLALPTHPCEFCGRLFGTKGGRTRHAQVHTRGRPHKCGQCGYSFHLRLNLLHHECVKAK